MRKSLRRYRAQALCINRNGEYRNRERIKVSKESDAYMSLVIAKTKNGADLGQGAYSISIPSSPRLRRFFVLKRQFGMPSNVFFAEGCARRWPRY